ncbi:MAG: glutamyl-tRNA reductase [Bernardetiaceae bacterium]|nr:glutamyl-tRNA reductase [Bernardetiaceae bacterium]
MTIHFRVLSISYHTADVETREKCALNDNQIRDLLFKLREMLAIEESLVLSTCNRTEIYYQSDTDLSLEVVKILLAQKGSIEKAEALLPYFKVLNESEAAVRHLFEVSMGLDSQVIGDLQISNQVKKAYQAAADAQMAGPFLHRLMHTIFYTNKRVSQETSFRDGAASVSYTAAELTGELAAMFSDPQVLVIGTGEIGIDTVRNLQNTNIQKVWIANRTEEKARRIAAETGYTHLPFSEIADAIKKSDVIICSVARQEPFIQKTDVEACEILAFKHFIDLSIPRSIAPDIEEVAGAVLYNIDEISRRVNETIQKRKASMPKVREIIEEALEGFSDWTKEMLVSPAIQQLKNTLEQIRKEEMGRYLKNAEAEEYEKIDRITKSMMQKIIKLPVLQLKAACKRGEAETLVDVLNNLFNLEAQEEVEVTK